MRAASLLQPPRPRPGSVARRELLGRLTESLPAKLVLVAAPPGWGKTTLLCDWWLAAEEADRAWLSVETPHNDPVQFWSGVAAAIGTVPPAAGASAIEALTSSAAKTSGYVEPLLGHLAALPGRITLVLDDFHLITNPHVLAGFEYLVDHLPPTLGLVVAGRSDPPLPLARLRAHGELAEIRTADLAFSEAEAAQLLGGTLGLDLPAGQRYALWQRTEGWAAGLYLAGLALRTRKDGDRAGFIATFGGDDRNVADYLAAEVLAGLAPRIRSFLLHTCVLDRMSAPLCDAVTASAGSQALLEEIDRAQLFAVSLDNARRWYRYHAMFAEMLRSELDRCEPGMAALLHRRASAWYRQHGEVTEAIGHALAAGDLADAQDLIAAHWYDILNEGLADTMQSWLDQLPSDMVAKDARMCLLRGALAMSLGRVEDVPPWLEAAEAAVPMGPFQGPASVESAAGILQALYRHLTGDLAGAEKAIRSVLESTAPGSTPWRDSMLALLGTVLFWRGQDCEAAAAFEQVIRPTSQTDDNFARLSALGHMAAIAAHHGDREKADRYLREAAALAARHDLRGHWVTVVADLVTTVLLADRGELAAAGTVARQALDNARRGQARLETAAALMGLAKIESRAGRKAQARARTGEARDIIGQCPDPGILTSQLAETEHQEGLSAPVPPPRGRGQRPDGLTDREAEVLSLVARGDQNCEIAAKLSISVHTVERHLQNAYRKIGVRNRADAAAHMARNGG